MYEKLILLTKAQREKLENIQKNVKENGGHVSMNQLIRDSIQVFVQNSFYD